MDKDQLLQRWVPIGSIREGPVPSYEAKGPDGRFVQVHRISSKDPDFQRLSALIKRVVPHPPPDLVEIGEFDGGMAVVTHILPSQMGLEDWLNDALGGGEGPPEVAEAPDVAEAPEVTEAPEAAGQEDADYSAYFRIPPGTDSGGVPEAAQEGAPESEEESYTSIFQASPEPSEPGPTPAEPVPAAMEPEPGPAPADRDAPPPPLPPPPSGPPSGEEGYTALFEAASLAPEEKGPGTDGLERRKEEEPPRTVSEARPSPPPAPPPEEPPSRRPPDPPRQAPRGSPSIRREAEGITDMFRKREPRPPAGESRRPQKWDDRERAPAPLQISLDEYIRRLERPY